MINTLFSERGVGLEVGTSVGPKVGKSEGDFDGPEVGESVGDVDGPEVGELVGDFDGLSLFGGRQKPHVTIQILFNSFFSPFSIVYDLRQVFFFLFFDKSLNDAQVCVSSPIGNWKV